MDMTKLRQKESTGKEDYVKVVFLWPIMVSSKAWEFRPVCTYMPI